MKMKKFLKWTVAIVAIITLLSMIIAMFDFVAVPVSNMAGKSVEGVKSFFRTVTAVGLGTLVALAGLASIAAAPVIGVVLIAIGIGSIVYALWPVLSPNE
jgi:hypothetical protein